MLAPWKENYDQPREHIEKQRHYFANKGPSSQDCPASLVAQRLKRLPPMRETRVQSLGWEDPLQKEMAIHSSILAWRIPMERGAWQATVHGVTKSRTRLKRLSRVQAVVYPDISSNSIPATVCVRVF